MTAWSRLFELGRRQGGVIAVAQAVETGLAASTLRRRAAREGWHQLHRGVFVLPGASLNADVLTWAAVLAVGDHATITGESALHVLGALDAPPVRVHLVVPATRRAPRLDGVRITRSRTLVRADRLSLEGRWVAAPPRAFLDAAARCGRERLRILLIDARQRRVVAVSEVAARALAVQRLPGRGRLLRACGDVDASGADSALAAEVERRLRAEGFRLDVPPRSVASIGRHLQPDITIEDVPVGIEVDGFGTHANRRALDVDQRKHNAYQVAGWTMLRISWTRLHEDWDGFVAELRAAVADARRRVGRSGA